MSGLDGGLADGRRVRCSRRDGGGLSRFLEAVEAAGIDPTASETDPVTVVAPTDDAFEALEALFGEPDRLAELVSRHVIHGRQSMARLARLPAVTAIDGDHLLVGAEGGLAIEGARVTLGDVRCQDGILHTIDRVLVPDGEEVETD